MNSKSPPAIEDWLCDIRQYASDIDPACLPLLDGYIGEARFGRAYIAAQLLDVPLNGYLLEIGAGSLLLSCQLVREGYMVTALEPVSDGFSHFNQIKKLVCARAAELGCLPELIEAKAETLNLHERFDLAFSINVMEHVGDVEAVVTRVVNALKFGALYRFTCPNYLFPYEPHFNIPTLFSKKFTENVFSRYIFRNENIPDSAGLWRSLNWITVPQLSDIAKRIPQTSMSFNKKLIVSTLERVVHDSDFSSRRAPWISSAIKLLVRSGAHRLFGLVPAVAQPIIDCSIRRNESSGACL